MEFNEKLQLLRKQQEMTQEQLAEKLFVSRTAVSKWESGKGYPNIDSLRNLAEVFSVSIDELLSGEELMEAAESEKRQTLRGMQGLLFGILDLLAAGFFFIPLFSQKEGDYFAAVPLTQFQDTSPVLLAITYGFLVLMVVVGILELILLRREEEKWWKGISSFSLGWNALAVLFFISTRQLYVSTFLFLFIMVKAVLLIKGSRAT